MTDQPTTTTTTTTLQVSDQGMLRHALESAYVFRISAKQANLVPVLDCVRLRAEPESNELQVWGCDRYRLIRSLVPLDRAPDRHVSALIPSAHIRNLVRQLSTGQVTCSLTVDGTLRMTLDTYDSQSTVGLQDGDWPNLDRLLDNCGKPTSTDPATFSTVALAAETVAKLAKVKPHPSELRDRQRDPGGLYVWWGDRRKTARFMIGRSGRVVGSFLPYTEDVDTVAKEALLGPAAVVPAAKEA